MVFTVCLATGTPKLALFQVHLFTAVPAVVLFNSFVVAIVWKYFAIFDHLVSELLQWSAVLLIVFAPKQLQSLSGAG